MKRASYREGVAWIAQNDEAASSDSDDAEVISGYVSTCLLADLFGVDQRRVAEDVVKYRENQERLQRMAGA